jgi:uncharacterized LabA/DUF88 family protein
MTTITTDEAAPSAEPEGPTAEQPTARPRRFAPRRSRAGALTATQPDSPASADHVPDAASDPAENTEVPVIPPTPAGELEIGGVPHLASAPSPSVGRSRRGRDRRPLADTSPAEVSAQAQTDVSAAEMPVPSSLEGAIDQPIVTGEPGAAEPPLGTGAARRSATRRGSGRGRQAKPGPGEGNVPGDTVAVSGTDAVAAKSTPSRPTQARRARPSRRTPTVTQVEESSTAIAAGEEIAEPVIVVAELSTDPATEIGTGPAADLELPVEVVSEPTAEAAIEPTAEEESRFGSDLADLFGLTTREAAAATADLEGADLLARALREMFPPIDAAGAATAGVAPDDNLPVFDFEAAAAAFDAVLDALPDPEDGAEDDEGGEAEDGPEIAGDSEEAQRRRSRRGRRGGRGRRRNGLVMLPSPADGEPVAAEPVPIRPDLSASHPALPPPIPIQIQPDPTPVARVAELAPSSPFVPEDPPRNEANWREQRPRRNWGKPQQRETARTEMPPPKPSSTRFIPIPQAAPPPAALSLQVPAAAPGTPFTMPDLRTDEPLGPGETRSERLLQVQTRLMAAMLEQQARQIDVLTAGVSSLYQALQGLGGGVGGTRANLPRTGIFVDAPNVVYAADNARVSIDYGRMLKYLSRDRQLVHALSYSPIIDDIREGIRYETQRFVAPFIRAGYKLITKPLKRFSDGSAKGNFDIELALDILTMAERLDIVVLVSGDSDFESVIEHIQSQGVRVEVVAFASNVSTELVNVADTFIDINQHLEHMRTL